MAKASPKQWQDTEGGRQAIHEWVERLLDREGAEFVMEVGYYQIPDPDNPPWVLTELDGSETLTIRVPPVKTRTDDVSHEFEEADYG